METKITNLRKNLKRLRTERGLTQQELSDSCGFDRTYIGKIERGERIPSLESFFRVVDALNIDPQQLYEDSDLTDGEVRFPVKGKGSQSPFLGEQYFQWFQSIVELEQNTFDDPRLLQYLQKLRLRLDLISYLYSKSVKAQGSRWADCRVVIKKLISNLKQSRLAPAHNHTLRMSVEEGIQLKSRDLYSLILVLNELLYETVVTILPEDPSRVITVFFEETVEGRFRAAILTEPPIPWEKISSIPESIESWPLVEDLVFNELRGELDIPRDHTELFRIEFDRPSFRRSNFDPSELS